MKKSILEQFANDIINAPAAITGGSGKGGGGKQTKLGSKKSRAGKSGSSKSGLRKSGSSKSGGCSCMPPQEPN